MTPMAMPAFAPVLRPEELDLGEGVGDDAAVVALIGVVSFGFSDL